MSEAPSPPPPSPAGDATPHPRGLRLLWEHWSYSLVTAAYFGVLGFILMGVVPSFEQMFEEVNIQYLPSMTAAVILCGRWTCRCWFLYVPAAIYLSWLVARIPPRRRWMFEIGLICTMAAVTGFIVYALFLPRITMTGARE